MNPERKEKRAKIAFVCVFQELAFFTDNLNSIATQGALLAGFAYGGLTQVDIPDGGENK